MGLRDLRQKELSDKWLNGERKGIILAAPRMGKCFVGINILEQLFVEENRDINILIGFPDNKIKKSWEEDFVKRNYTNSNITFTTHLSLKKHVDEEFDLIILDECHLLSTAQIEVLTNFKSFETVLGLTGTLSHSTEMLLKSALDLPVLAKYSIEQAIEEGIIPDYEISVIKVPLERGLKIEKTNFDRLSYVINKLEDQGKDTKFLRLGRMRIIQNSIAKLNKTKELLLLHKEERVLVFCGITKIADSLGIPSYHSKSTEKQVFRDFVEGVIPQLAVCKIGNTGVTFTPLNRVIINSFDSNPELLTQRINRCMSYEYNNPEKIAKIYIISSTEEIELKWLKRALEFFNPEKIKYL